MTESSAPERIEFLDFHRPALESGDYRITVEQRLAAPGKVDQKFPQAIGELAVRGERYALSPSLVTAVFPPAGSVGDHANVMPHLVLGRSTLPWERSGHLRAATKDPLPWLALLLFDESEHPEVSVVRAADLASGDARFPKTVLETGAQHEDDPVSVLDVPEELLRKIAPNGAELPLLAHARQGMRAGDPKKDLDKAGKPIEWVPVGNEVAVVLCNRLPRPGATSTVHLVSLEGRYNTRGVFIGASKGDLVRLVSLYSWSFTCPAEGPSFKGLVRALDRDPPFLRLPAPENEAEPKILTSGYLRLSHQDRHGESPTSLYRGPLLPGRAPAAPDRSPLAVRAADQLLRIGLNGTLDLSYAAAWELGRLLMLADKRLSERLFQWKRSHCQQKAESGRALGHLAFGGDNEPPGFPPEVAAWFAELALLRGVPFNYLVADERLLPDESLRLFQLDGFWVECLLAGAFSIGRVTGADHAHAIEHGKVPAANPHPTLTGFLLRSEVVAGWPHLQADAAGTVLDHGGPIAEDDRLPARRMDRLAPNVLLGLYEGEVQTLDLHLKPEGMHFGLDRDTSGYYKALRDSTGDPDGLRCPVAWKVGDEKQRVVNVLRLRDSISQVLKPRGGFGDPFSTADFALEMIEGAEGVRFLAEN